MSNWNGGFIKASQEVWNLLVKIGYKEAVIMNNGLFSHIYAKENEISMCNLEFINVCNEQKIKYKQFYINNGELSWNEPEIFRESTAHKVWENHINSIATAFNEIPTIQEGDEDAITDSRDDMCNNGDSDSLEAAMEITDDGKVCKEAKEHFESIKQNYKEAHFNAFGFQVPDFECSIKYKTNRWLMGVMANYNAPAIWDEEGRCLHQQVCDRSGNDKYNLAPINFRWFENEANFPSLLKRNDGTAYTICYSIEGWESSYKYDHRLATKDEVMSLHYKGKQ